MALYNFNGTNSALIGKLHNNNGTVNQQIGKVYEFNGASNRLVYTADEYLFDKGAFGIGGKVIFDTSDGGGSNISGDYIQMWTGGNNYYYMKFSNAVNMSKYKTLKATCVKMSASSGANPKACLGASVSNRWGITAEYPLANVAVGATFTISLNISNFSETTIPWIGVAGGGSNSGNVKYLEVWLEE